MTTKTKTDLSGRISTAMLLLWFFSYALARGIMETAEAPAVRVFFALLPIPFFIALIVTVFRAIDRGDELFRRIHLEALAFAFPATLTLIMVLGLLELAVGLNPNDWSYRHVWPMCVMAYYGGWALAMRKYK
jgi:amino acid transporter